MTKPLAISQRQVQSLIRAAAAERAIVEVKIGDAVVRLIPEGNPQAPSRLDDDVSPEAFDTLDEYLAWRNRSGAGGA